MNAERRANRERYGDEGTKAEALEHYENEASVVRQLIEAGRQLERAAQAAL